MSEIVYLLGAGASRGVRTTDNNLLPFDVDLGDNHIIEGLPLVYEIPDRLEYVISQIKSCVVSKNTQKVIFPIGNNAGTGFEEARTMLVNDLLWLKEQSAAHATIDTFAKKLFLTKQKYNFYKVEMLLSIFFVIEQIINKPDGRYDTFLASVLTTDLNLPDNITIATWNYDSQFEIAYKKYLTGCSYSELRNRLKICDLKDDYVNLFKDKCNKIFKVNGTANFMKTLPITEFVKIDEKILTIVLEHYIKDSENPEGTRLSFAWDFSHFENGKLNIFLKDAVKDAKTLIVIGYTFPFFNREIDRGIFDAMGNLRKIYIQDPKADSVKQNIMSILSNRRGGSYLYDNLSLITNTDQFFLPPEM